MHVLTEGNLFREPLELLCMAVGWGVEHYFLGRYGVFHFESTTVYGKVGVPISKCHVGKPVYRLLTQHCSISPIPGFSF